MADLTRFMIIVVVVALAIAIGVALGTFASAMGAAAGSYYAVVAAASNAGLEPLQWLDVFNDTINFPVGAFVTVRELLTGVAMAFSVFVLAYWTWRISTRIAQAG